MTSLVPTSTGTDLDLTGDLGDVLRRITAAKAVAEAETPAAGLQRVQVTKEALAALDKLSGLLQTIEFPTEARELSASEKRDYLVLADEAKTAQKALDDAVLAVKQAVFGHFDTKLLEDNAADDLPKDEENGWFLVADEMIIPDTGKRMTRELAEQQPQLSAAALKQLWQEKKISRADYYAMTVPNDARRFDGEKFLAHLKKKPALVAKLADVIVPGKITARFWVRSLKKGSK